MIYLVDSAIHPLNNWGLYYYNMYMVLLLSSLLLPLIHVHVVLLVHVAIIVIKLIIVYDYDNDEQCLILGCSYQKTLLITAAQYWALLANAVKAKDAKQTVSSKGTPPY